MINIKHKKIKSGDIYETKNNGKIIILDYYVSSSVKIRFIDTGFIKYVSADNIRNGYIIDKLKPRLCGVGFVGVGKHKASINRKDTKAYKRWHGMMQRCYNKNKYPDSSCYEDVTVCEEWHNFQNFAEWYSENYIEGYHLDKDIKVKGNRVYSPKACMFVSNSENSRFSSSRSYLFISPEGIETKIVNLWKFSKDNNLGYQGMHDVYHGRLKSHKKWRKV